ncbi:protein containing Glutaminase, core domain protein, partial [human gut metagenome]
LGIAAFAPPLDGAGNSVKAQKALARIAARLDLGVFHPTHCIPASAEAATV